MPFVSYPSSRALFLVFLLLFSGVLFISFPALAQNPIDFTLKDTDGNPVHLADLLGKNVILIDFWATWCVPCVKELTHFQKFHETYKDKGLLILALSEDGPETVAMVKPFLKRYKYAFKILLDTESRVLALYNPSVVMPYTLLIDRSGKIAKVHQGYNLGDEKVIEQEIVELLEPKEVVARKGLTLNVNEAFLNRNFSDKDYVDNIRGGRATQVINQLDLSVNVGDYLAGARVDTSLDFSPWWSNFKLAKGFFEFNRKSVNLRTGDFYYTVGRGLAFSLLKTFEKEGLEYIIDTTVRGGKFAFTRPQYSAEVFGGWIEREKTKLFQKEEAIRDKIYGGTLGWRIKSFADLKLNFVGSQIERGTLLGSKDATMESVTLDIPNVKDKAKFYGEFLLIQKKKYFVEDRIDGHGAYLESGFFVKNLTMLIEFKDYKNLDFEYNRPPLLETEQLPIVANQFVSSAKDITGIAGRVDYYFPKVSTLLFGKLSYQNDKSEKLPRDITHFFGGFEIKFKETGWLTLLGGYRREKTSSLIFWDTAGNTFHVQANLSYPLTRRLSLEFDLESKDFKGTVSFGGRYYNYYEQRSYLSFSYSPILIVTFLYDRTTDPKILTYKDKKDWPGVQLEIKFSHAKSIRIFYGSNKGGVKCSGGVCKFFPPFEGLRIDGVLRF
jgi:peroxiredoxin